MDFLNEKSKSGNCGFHISGIVCGRKINFSLDSGSTASFLSAGWRAYGTGRTRYFGSLPVSTKGNKYILVLPNGQRV